MSSLIRLLLVFVGLAIGASWVYADSSGCGVLEFSKKVLNRFPDVRRACLKVVVMRDGQAYGVVKGDVVRVYDVGNAIDLRFKLRDGTRSEIRHLKTSPELRVMIRGIPTPVNKLAVGDELTAYVKVYEPQLALTPAEPAVELQFMQIQIPKVSLSKE